jgi:hypothetical protein
MNHRTQINLHVQMTANEITINNVIRIGGHHVIYIISTLFKIQVFFPLKIYTITF